MAAGLFRHKNPSGTPKIEINNGYFGFDFAHLQYLSQNRRFYTVQYTSCKDKIREKQAFSNLNWRLKEKIQIVYFLNKKLKY